MLLFTCYLRTLIQAHIVVVVVYKTQMYVLYSATAHTNFSRYYYYDCLTQYQQLAWHAVAKRISNRCDSSVYESVYVMLWCVFVCWVHDSAGNDWIFLSGWVDVWVDTHLNRVSILLPDVIFSFNFLSLRIFFE